MSLSTRMYAVSHDEAAQAVVANGMERNGQHVWFNFEGLKGIGKSTLAKEIARLLPKHTLRYVDTTAMTAGDSGIPKFKEADDQDFVRYVANEVLGLHLGVPLIIMLDELSKASREVMLPFLRLGLEREMFGYRLHPDSVVISNGNLTVENLGDGYQAHQLDRFTVMELRTPTNKEWIGNFAVPNNINPMISGWALQTPELFQDWRDVPNPDDNQYIDHPQAVGRRKGVTCRGLAKCGYILDNREGVSDHLLRAMLAGTIGYYAAEQLMTFMQIADELPSLESIKSDPSNAKVPTNVAAVGLVVYRALSNIDRSWVDAWMTYIDRLDEKWGALFVQNVSDPRFNKDRQSQVMTNAKFTKYAHDHQYLFNTADVV